MGLHDFGKILTICSQFCLPGKIIRSPQCLHLAYDRTFISRRNGSISYNINKNGNIRLDEQKGITKHRAVPRVSNHVDYALSSTSGHLRCRCFSNWQSQFSASRVVGVSPPTSLAFEDSEPGQLQRDCLVLLHLIPAQTIQQPTKVVKGKRTICQAEIFQGTPRMLGVGPSQIQTSSRRKLIVTPTY